MFGTMISQTKTRSLGQILEKSYTRSRDHIFRLILMTRGQNICLNDISEEFVDGSEKPCVHSRGHVFSPMHMKLRQNVNISDILDRLTVGRILGHSVKS